MKQLVMLGLLVFLVGCSSSGGESGSEPESAGETYPFRLAMETVNICDQRTAFSEYEVLVYNSLGELISRHKPNEEGILDTSLKESRANLMIVKKNSDNSNLNITVLADYPIGNLGTFLFYDFDKTGCNCDRYNAVVSVSETTDFRANRPYSFKGSDIDQVTYTDLEICDLPDGKEQTLLFSQLNEFTGGVQYLDIPETSLEAQGNDLSIDFQNFSKLGRPITFNNPYQTGNSISYQLDQKYISYFSFFELAINNQISLIEEPSITPVLFEAVNYESIPGGGQNDYSFWGVTHPLSVGITEIEVVKPIEDPFILEGLITDYSEPYDVSGQEFRFVAGRDTYKLPNNRYDAWDFIMPDKRDYRLSLELPSDYQPEGLGNLHYSDFKYHGSWAIKIVDSEGTYDDVYTSGWLRVSLPIVPTHHSVIPPSSFSRIALLKGFEAVITD
ncbi:hypothetical protein [Litoribacillus peritrichatus]|uniref:Uncharacterized protein n=1 Tax=Litoribacillus peritrichatus TaxID=718191 RepID=A0ABP7MQ86_9GAMM